MGDIAGTATAAGSANGARAASEIKDHTHGRGVADSDILDDHDGRCAVQIKVP